jgi:hypothetical protein
MDEESIARQRERDAEYLHACREAGIEPDPPRYSGQGDTEHLDLHETEAQSYGAKKNGTHYAAHREEPAPLTELTPEMVGAAKTLEMILPRLDRHLAKNTVAAGRRALVLAWLLGRCPRSLADLATELGVTRACLSSYATELNDRLGVRGRGQKGEYTRKVYAANARKSWKLRRLNKALAEAVDAGEN